MNQRAIGTMVDTIGLEILETISRDDYLIALDAVADLLLAGARRRRQAFLEGHLAAREFHDDLRAGRIGQATEQTKR